MVTGHIHTGAVTQDVTAGGVLFLRSVQQPGFYSAANPYSPDGVVQDGAVYTYVGSDNIYQPIARFPRRAAQLPREPARIRRPAPPLGRQPSILRRDSGPHPSSRPHPAHRRRPLRFAARPQLLALGHRSQRRRPPSPTSPSGCRSSPSPSAPSRTSRSTRTTASCCRSVRRRRSGPTTAASFSRPSSPARPRSAQNTSPASAFCSPPRSSTCARRSSIPR